jgi:hypothetical protein
MTGWNAKSMTTTLHQMRALIIRKDITFTKMPPKLDELDALGMETCDSCSMEDENIDHDKGFIFCDKCLAEQDKQTSIMDKFSEIERLTAELKDLLEIS